MKGGEKQYKPVAPVIEQYIAEDWNETRLATELRGCAAEEILLQLIVQVAKLYKHKEIATDGPKVSGGVPSTANTGNRKQRARG